MGRLRLRSHRVAAALVLTVVAVAVPTGAWFVAGTHRIEREADLEEGGLYDKSYKKAVVLAERLATRLELLREAESRRPFYHYQNLFHDPRGAAEGASVSISPLAQGAADPLIEAHFQVDEAGALTLPTLNDEFPELGLVADEEAQCALLAKLEELAIFCDGGLVPAGKRRRSGPPPAERPAEVLTRGAWRQHLRANDLYADLKEGRRPDRGLDLGGDRARSGGPRSDVSAAERLEIAVGPFAWYTLPVGGEPALAAVRSVETPAGTWNQGFVISPSTVARALESSSYPAAFVPLEPGGSGAEGAVAVAVEGTPWGIALDVSDRLAETALRAAAERRRFLRIFLLGALAAGLSGLLVVAMVYQSDRLAQQRAQFAAAAAHELRTPLAGLRLYGEMLAEGLGDPQRARDYARRLAGEAERLGRVVTNVLSFTRLERGQLSVKPAAGDLAAAVRDACRRQRPALEESGARLELELADDLPAVHFDRDAVGHILQNLLDNAEKYTRGVDDRAIRVALSPNGRSVELEVADNGRGISPQLRRRLFRPFSRGGNRDAPEGLGLGLALVRLLAEAQGGEVRYRDAPAGGAVFSVTMPIATPA